LAVLKPPCPTQDNSCAGREPAVHSDEHGVLILGPLDASRFISVWLTLVPHAAGRLFRADDLSWTLSESYFIPVTFSSYEDSYTEEQLYNTFQPILDPIPWTFWPPEDVESHPLTRFKVTNLTQTGETAITIHMCHVIADGFSMLRVLNILSDLYCGASVSEQMPATFETYFDRPPPYLDPAGEAYSRALSRLPNFSMGYAPHALSAKWKEYAETQSSFSFRRNKWGFYYDGQMREYLPAPSASLPRT